MRVNDDVVVKDLSDGKFYHCKVVNAAEGEIKVHYCGWNKSKVEWINSDSDRIIRDSNNVTVWTRSHGQLHPCVVTGESRERCGWSDSGFPNGV